MAQSFEEMAFAVGEQVPSPKALEAMEKRRTGNVLRTSLWILQLSCLLSLTGMVAALWHVGWWIGVVFFAMVIIQVIVITVVVISQPPRSREEKEQRRRSREEITRQVKERYKKNQERT